MDAVAREFARRDIIPDLAGLRALDQQISDEVAQALLRMSDVLVSMQKYFKFRGVALVSNERVGIEHSFEALAGAANSISERSEMFEVARDVTFVPRDQDRFHVWVVLVQRRTSDAGLLGNLRHRHRA